MDTQRLIGEVAARHGVRLEPDDPAFVLVTLAEVMLGDAQREFTAAVRKSIAEFVQAAEGVQARTGLAMAAAIRAASKERSAAAVRNAGPPPAPPRRFHWTALGICVGSLLFLAGMAVGRMLPP
jgi:hypothetical protein